MILVVGATGYLGGETCRLLRAEGKPVRALVRKTSDAARVDALRAQGVEIVEGDLKHHASLQAATHGADIVISTASATLSRQEGDSLLTVDRDGQQHLVGAAHKAGAKQFIYVSFAPVPLSFTLQDAKRSVEKRLIESGIPYTILQPVNFTEVWLSAVMGFDAQAGKVRVLGSGDAPVSWISFFDVARFAAAAAGNPKALNKTFELVGDKTSYHAIVKTFEELSGKKFELEHLPEEALSGQLQGAPDPVSQAFAALMLSAARGAQKADVAEALAAMPVAPLRTVRDYAKAVLSC